MRENQRDGLRMLVVNEFRQLLRVGLLQRVEAGQLRSQRLHQPVYQSFGMLRAKGRHQHFLGVIDAALEHVLAGHGHLVELFENGLGLVVADGSDPRDFLADGLHLFFVHLPQNLAADLIPQNDHQNGRLANTGRGLDALGLKILNHRLVCSPGSAIQALSTCAMLLESFLACSEICLVSTSAFLVTGGSFRLFSASKSFFCRSADCSARRFSIWAWS